MTKYLLFSFISLVVFTGCSSSKSGSKKLDKRNAETYYTYGTQSLIKKDYTKALGHLLKAVSFDAKDSKIHNNLGMTYFFKGKIEKAVQHLKTAAQLKDNNTEARNNLASIYFHQRLYTKAEKLYNEVLQDLLYQSQFRTYYNLALISKEKRDDLATESYLKKSVEDNPNYCPAQYMLGTIYENKNQISDAAIHYRKATLNNCFTEAEPNLALSLVLVKLKKWKDAEGKLTDFLTRFPKHPKRPLAQKNLIFVQAKLSNFQKKAEKINNSVNSSYDQLDQGLEWEKTAKNIKSPNF